MDRWDNDPDRAEIDPLTDQVGLWTASDPEELWRALVVHSDRSTTDHWLAVQLFRRHHADGTPGALTTALLLCTGRAPSARRSSRSSTSSPRGSSTHR
jgi:hypothetical protein